MKRLMTRGAAGLVIAALPALALAQTTPPTQPQQTAPPTQPQQQSTPQSQPQQTMPQQMQQRSTPTQPQTGGVQQEVATAHAHALMAQGAKTVDMAHTHLHHVINCLEGSSGTDFDANAENPCKGMGQGAIPDSMTNQTMQTRLRQALAAAQAGLKASDLAGAQRSAAQAANMLQTQAQPTSGGM